MSRNGGIGSTRAPQAIRLDPTYIKAYYRRGSANFALGKYKLALRDFKAVCKLRPNDRDARNKLRECEKAAKQLAFACAIEASDDPSQRVSATLDAGRGVSCLGGFRARVPSAPAGAFDARRL